MDWTLATLMILVLLYILIDVKKKKLYIIEEYVKQGMLNDEIANVIKQLGYAKEEITADSAETKKVQPNEGI